MHYVLCTLVVRGAAVKHTNLSLPSAAPLAAVKPHPPSRSWQPGYLAQGAQRSVPLAVLHSRMQGSRMPGMQYLFTTFAGIISQ
jgi:hypothetical protein